MKLICAMCGEVVDSDGWPSGWEHYETEIMVTAELSCQEEGERSPSLNQVFSEVLEFCSRKCASAFMADPELAAARVLLDERHQDEKEWESIEKLAKFLRYKGLFDKKDGVDA